MDEHFESVKNSLRKQSDKLDYVITKLERELSTANQRNACLEEQLTVIQIEVHKECLKTKELSEMSIEKLWEENTHLKEELELTKNEKSFADQSVEASLRDEIERLKAENERLREEKNIAAEAKDNCIETFKWENEELKRELRELQRSQLQLDSVEELESTRTKLQKEVKEKNDIIEEMILNTEGHISTMQELLKENTDLKERIFKITNSSVKEDSSIQTGGEIDFERKYEELKNTYDKEVAKSAEHGKNCEYEIERLTAQNNELLQDISVLHQLNIKHENEIEENASLREINLHLEKQVSSMAEEIERLRRTNEEYERDVAFLKLNRVDSGDQPNRDALKEKSCDCFDLDHTYGDQTQCKTREISQLRDDLSKRDEMINSLRGELQRLSPSADLGDLYKEKDNIWYQKYQESLIVMDELQAQVKMLEQENEMLRESTSIRFSEGILPTSLAVTNYSVRDLKLLIDDLIKENSTLKMSLQNVLSNLEDKVNKLLHENSRGFNENLSHYSNYNLGVDDFAFSLRRGTLDKSRDSLELKRSVSMREDMKSYDFLITEADTNEVRYLKRKKNLC